MNAAIPGADGGADLRNLFAAICDETISADQFQQLEETLSQDAEARARFARLTQLHVLLEQMFADASRHAEEAAPANTSNHSAPAAIVAPVVPFENTIHGAIGYLSSGWPVAYLVATVVFAVGLVVGAIVHVSQPVNVVQAPNSLPSPVASHPTEEPAVIGRITGVADCVWDGSGASNQDSELINHKSAIRLGDCLALKSGLVEITYDTGAKVLLQGPVTYEVESAAGGYLSIGKLTARLEERSEDRDQRSEVRGQKFVVRTPTATVTDLGTEFGVEVTKDGLTTSHVFRGTIEVRAVSADPQAAAVAKRLHASESARVEGDGETRRVVLVPNFAPSTFAREIAKRTIKTFDLVDAVAGGNGVSHRRDRGIDATTGRVATVQPDERDLRGDYQYHRVESVPFVDGVFIPDGSRGPVKIDSAGHVFPDCPKTDNRSWAHIWAGGKLPDNVAPLMSATLAGVDYSTAEHALLTVHANKGITFDLDAIRRSNPQHKVVRFRAVAGNTECKTKDGEMVSADIWVLVDGQVRFKRREVNNYNGAAPIVIPLHAKDRFLTLAATDSGNTYRADQIIFGDPQLEMELQGSP
jgi:hypothetical protein